MAKLFLNYRPQKEKPHWTRLVVCGNLVIFQGNFSTRTADITTAKLLFNSTISKKCAWLLLCDIKQF